MLENSAMRSSYAAVPINFGGTLVICTLNAGYWCFSDLKVEKGDLRDRKNQKQNLTETFLGAKPSRAVQLRLEKLYCCFFFLFRRVCNRMLKYVSACAVVAHFSLCVRLYTFPVEMHIRTWQEQVRDRNGALGISGLER